MRVNEVIDTIPNKVETFLKAQEIVIEQILELPKFENEFKPNKKAVVLIGQKLTGKDFIIDETNKNVIKLLWDYFIESESELDKSKGILLIGDVGTGKTLIMRIFSELLKGTPKNFQIASAVDIQIDAITDLKDTINRYSKNQYFNEYKIAIDKPFVYCFDDLGSENQYIKSFGNEVSPIGLIMQLRYNQFCYTKLKTFATSNLDIEHIKEFYRDERLKSRFKEMFNILTLTGKDRR